MVLAPHTDDGEFGCGATIAKFLDDGIEVFYTAFSVCEQAVPYGLSTDVLEKELKQATRVLGIPPENLIIHRYEVRKFPAFRQEILQDILDTKKTLRPDLVFMPSLDDIHQDHQTVAHEGLRAYKDTTLLSFEVPWNNRSFETSTFIRIKEHHLERKIQALHCYQSQSHRHYANEDFLRSLALVRGTQLGTGLAEAFELVRLVMS